MDMVAWNFFYYERDIYMKREAFMSFVKARTLISVAKPCLTGGAKHNERGFLLRGK